MNLERFYQGKVVVITGSSRGIGRETARLALSAGATVVLNGRNQQILASVSEEFGGALAVAADVSRPEGATELIRQTLEWCGHIDVVIANAGQSMRGSFSDLVPAAVHTMIDANLLSAVWTAQAALPALRASRGRLVFVSSLAAARGFSGVSLYSAAKMALTAVQQAIAAEEPAVKPCVVYLPFTENDAGKMVLGSDGQPFRHQRLAAATQADSARSVLVAAVRGRNTVMTAQGRLLFWAQALFPSLVDWLMARSAGKIHAVRRSS
jgi:NAD(P)-dependent dehydrogenase (short-subunit alcohol dehydrogenase family)